MNSPKKLLIIIFCLLAIVVSLWIDTGRDEEMNNGMAETLEEVQYADFLKDVENKFVATIYFQAEAEVFYIEKTDSSCYKVMNPDYDNFKKDMMENGIAIKGTDEFNNLAVMTKMSTWAFFRGLILLFALPALMVFIFRYFYIRKNNHIVIEATTGTEFKPNTPNAKKIENNIKTFKDVAGLQEVKKDMQSLVDFLKNNEKYREAGAELPKGVVFYGPPGTGKTLLAKAVAGEANVSFYSASGSDFVEKYVGVGAKRVRELFANARKNAPCIIFIDEIDAIGGNRSNEDSNGEDRKTLNALLAEMDGFKTTENVLVIAATNRLEDLDPALLRPGRFTNKFCIPVPETTKERLEIIKMYARNKRFAEDVDFERLAKETMGFSPAALEALLNESAIISVQDRKMFIDKESIDKAMFKILLSGHMKENQTDRSPEELHLVAWHEAGHALVGKLNGKDIPKVTIVASTSGAGGVTFSTPKKTGLYSVDDLKDEVKELYAGRIAELLLLKNKNKVTTGASNDIERATKIIREIVTSYGMNDDFGLLNLNQLRVSQDVIIEREVKLAKEIEAETVKLLTENYSTLQKIAEGLLENETLYETDLDVIITGTAGVV